MDYAVGSVAALISGNVTPNRPRLVRRALTPTKNQASPNVTPKSEYLDDRSIFLSPSLQKKKAIVKKSPKRIFQSPDLEVTNDGEGSSVLSPKADKVKKHLKDDLEADKNNTISRKSPKSPKKVKGKANQSINSEDSKKKTNMSSEIEDKNDTEIRNVNESTPTKKKKQRNSIIMPFEDEKENVIENQSTEVNTEENKSNKKKRKLQISEEGSKPNDFNKETPKKKRKNKDLDTQVTEKTFEESTENATNQQQSKKKKKKNEKRKNNEATVATEVLNQTTEPVKAKTLKKKNKNKSAVNPNAITNKDSDSEHESDNEIESENEQTNNEILDTGPADSSEDEEEGVKKEQKKEKKEINEEDTEEEVKRTLFVGNVPFSKKCKKEIKNIFRKYGQIETIRIRTIPVKDARVTPKLAVIRNELHPERSTVNIYVRFHDVDSVNKALVENNTLLNENHLRVTRSDTTGSEHDPHKAVFVGNLPFALEDDALRAKFENCGEIVSVRIVRDKKTNAGKGFGYVNFASKDGVELALAMSEEDLAIKNKILRIKRCTLTNRTGGRRGGEGRHQGNAGRLQGNQRPQPRSQGMMKRNQESGNSNFGRGQGFKRNQESRGPGNFGRNQPTFERNQGGVGRNQGGFGRNQGGLGRNQGGFGRNQGGFGRNQGGFGRNQGGFGRNQGGFDKNQEDRSQGQDGAHRRILKRKQNEEAGGPPDKRLNIDHQPAREKKPRKEFVGMTAEKKKKQKFNKGDKKKKALSEILMKHR